MLLGFERMLHHIDAVDPRCAARGIDEIEKEIDGCGLSGAVRPEQTEYFARLNTERQVIEGAPAGFVLHGEPIRFEHGILLMRWCYTYYPASSPYIQ